MLTPDPARKTTHRAFTLVELLVVFVIIGILAALLFTTLGVVSKAQKTSAARAELSQLQAAIEAYKSVRGHYPPDNPGNPAANPLFFELKGTVMDNSNGQLTFVTLDGSGRITANDLGVVFGANVNGFMNFPKSGGASDEAIAPKSFIQELRPNQIGQLVVGGQPAVNALLVCSVRGSEDPAQQIVPIAGNPHATRPGLNPWRYVSAKPTHNLNAYDLWIDIPIGGKMYRISNWSKDPQLL